MPHKTAAPGQIRQIERLHFPNDDSSRSGHVSFRISMCGKQIPSTKCTRDGTRITCGKCIEVIYGRARSWSDLASLTEVRKNLELAPVFQDAERFRILAEAHGPSFVEATDKRIATKLAEILDD